MLTRSLEVMRYIKASAGRSNLRVVFENKNEPRHDGKTIFLPKITAKMTVDELEEIMSSTDHEVAHDEYSDFAILKEKKINPSTSTLGLLWNIIEDSRVNALEAESYSGFRELWDKTTPRLLEKVLKNNTDDTPLSVAILALIRWDCEVSGPLFPSCALVGETYPRNEKFEKILEVFTPRLIACQEEPRKIEGTKLSYELARDIFRALGGDPDKEEREKFLELESGTEEKEAAGEEDKTKKSKETDKKTKEGKLKKKEDEEWCIKKVELKDLPSKLVTTHDLDHGHMSKVGLEHDTIFDSESWEITPVDDFIVVDYYNHSSTHTAQSSQLNTDSTAANFYCNAFETRIKNEVSVSENFAQQVKRLIQIRARVRYEYGVKKGKLDQARLSRIVLKTPGFSERVFKNKINSTVLNAAVTVLIDMSGSMAGDKVLYAGQAAVLLNNVFQVLQVPLEILGFTDTYVGTCPPVMYVYKPFIQPKLSEEELVKNIGASSASMLGNPDGESILWAYDRLLKRREKKRLLIVMSDGQPAASRGNTGLSELTLKVIEEIEQQKKVEIYGLGLCSSSVNDFYKDNSVVSNAADIPQKLLELIERKLFNEH